MRITDRQTYIQINTQRSKHNLRKIFCEGNNNYEHKISTMSPTTSGLAERQANAQAVRQAGMQQGCEDQ